MFETRFKLIKTAGLEKGPGRKKRRPEEGGEDGQNTKEDGETLSEFNQSLAESLESISNLFGENMDFKLPVLDRPSNHNTLSKAKKITDTASAAGTYFFYQNINLTTQLSMWKKFCCTIY